jgi:hypothetical protein
MIAELALDSSNETARQALVSNGGRFIMLSIICVQEQSRSVQDRSYPMLIDIIGRTAPMIAELALDSSNETARQALVSNAETLASLFSPVKGGEADSSCCL